MSEATFRGVLMCVFKLQAVPHSHQVKGLGLVHDWVHLILKFENSFGVLEVKPKHTKKKTYLIYYYMGYLPSDFIRNFRMFAVPWIFINSLVPGSL